MGRQEVQAKMEKKGKMNPKKHKGQEMQQPPPMRNDPYMNWRPPHDAMMMNHPMMGMPPFMMHGHPPPEAMMMNHMAMMGGPMMMGPQMGMMAPPVAAATGIVDKKSKKEEKAKKKEKDKAKGKEKQREPSPPVVK